MKALLLISALLIAGCSSASKAPPPPNAMPTEAIALLAKSAVDSCSVCSRNFRTKAFRLLEAQYPPNIVVRSDSLRWFMRAPGSANALILATEVQGDSGLTFRFHTTEDHLVGIPEADFTDESVADRCRSAPEGVPFQGALEVVAFPYGDGPTFLYHASDNRVEVQCRVLEIAE